MNAELKKILSRTWKNSVSTLASKQALILLFTTLKTFQRTLLLIGRHFWWLLLLHLLVYCSADVLAPSILFPIQSLGGIGFFWGVVQSVIAYALALVTVLAARPSVERKDVAYFSLYTIGLKEQFGFVLGLPFLLFFFCVHFLYLFPFPWLFFLFLFDRIGHDERFAMDLQSMGAEVKNAAIFCLYFFPAIFLLWFIERVASFIMVLAFGGGETAISGIIAYTVSYIGWVFMLSMVVSLYVKMKHSFAELFFAAFSTHE